LIIVFRAKDIELKVKMNIELDDYSQTEAFEETELQESSKIETFEVTLDLDGERLDKVLASSLKDISRSRLKTLIEDGLVKVNGVTVDKPKEKMSFGDEVSVEIKPRLEDMDFIATPMDIDVVYEDDDILVINKPAGLVVHPAAGHWDDTLLNGLLAYNPIFRTLPRAGIVHRLDRDTTGVVLFSLDKQTQPAFDQMVIDHAFEKHYLALAEGKIDWNEKLIDKPIARDRHDSRKMRVGASGKPSQTCVKVLKRLKSRRGLPARSYIDVELLTGRKHQIRVHLASERHPLVGDDLYGTPRPCGLMLHAHSVSFTHPVTGEHIYIEAPCPWEP